MSTPINGNDFILKKSKLISKFPLNIGLLEAILAHYKYPIINTLLKSDTGKLLIIWINLNLFSRLRKLILILTEFRKSYLKKNSKYTPYNFVF